jgi:F0F1-type ATP synthase assembly protein I
MNPKNPKDPEKPEHPEYAEYKSSESDRASMMRQIGLLGVITAEIVGFTGAGFGLGYLTVSFLGAPKWVIAITTMIGLGGAFWRLYKMSAREFE